VSVPISTLDWFLAYRRRGERAVDCLWRARCNAAAVKDAEDTLARLSPSSRARVERFHEWLIRSDEVMVLQEERDRDWINEPERAGRCHAAADHGCDGKTHAEVIDDWRDAFQQWCRCHGGKWAETPVRFITAVEAHATLCELWHEYHGSLHTEIG
jgi:hypothetical protein